MVNKDRIRNLNHREVRAGEYVLYWMQQSQRCHYNHALEYAIRRANQLDTKLLVVFGLTEGYPHANIRHYDFMLQGLFEVHKGLADRGIKMILRFGEPDQIALAMAPHARIIVCDRGYLRHQREWRRNVARHAECQVIQVESDVVVPVETASDKPEYAARFMRTKINRLVDQYLEELPETPPNRSSLNIRINGESFSSPETLSAKLKVDTSVKPVGEQFRGGTSQAIQRFDRFITSKLMQYTNNRNQPQTDDVSHIGMYLHFGQISPVFLALKIRQVKKIDSEIIDAFLEELIVRRELAINYVFYNDQYDSYNGLPNWAQTTLNQHAADPREYVYSQSLLEEAKTHDPYWNAAQNEMKYSGYMHNYMRMYWVKKILEWSNSPQDAFQTAIYLNNKYFIDGRDPNSYAGVSWGFGLHDRPWKERPIFGKVRYMNAAGLRRKCDIGAYVEKVNRMVQ